MINTAPEIEKPTTPKAQHREFVNRVVPKVQQAGSPNFTAQKAIPEVEQSVVTPNSPLERVGAQEPGSLEPNLSQDDSKPPRLKHDFREFLHSLINRYTKREGPRGGILARIKNFRVRRSIQEQSKKIPVEETE